MRQVLVVDDDPSIAELVQAVLEEEGFRVLLAGDGLQALAALRQHPCALVIADLMMPNMDGRALREAMAADPGLRALPVVLMTAATALSDADRRMFNAVLHKPFPLDELVRLTAELSAGPPPAA